MLLTRIVALSRSYFTNLFPYAWFLDADLHTVEFLRLNSPFLTTVLAAIHATYDPQCAHLVHGLSDHAHRLAGAVFYNGISSLEAVQALILIS